MSTNAILFKRVFTNLPTWGGDRSTRLGEWSPSFEAGSLIGIQIHHPDDGTLTPPGPITLDIQGTSMLLANDDGNGSELIPNNAWVSLQSITNAVSGEQAVRLNAYNKLRIRADAGCYVSITDISTSLNQSGGTAPTIDVSALATVSRQTDLLNKLEVVRLLLEDIQNTNATENTLASVQQSLGLIKAEIGASTDANGAISLFSKLVDIYTSLQGNVASWDGSNATTTLLAVNKAIFDKLSTAVWSPDSSTGVSLAATTSDVAVGSLLAVTPGKTIRVSNDGNETIGIYFLNGTAATQPAYTAAIKIPSGQVEPIRVPTGVTHLGGKTGQNTTTITLHIGAGA